MATRLQFYSALAERAAATITENRSGMSGQANWTRFLETAARMYKYPFPDQLMIYAQRSDATACAELEFWNEKFDRWVRRGSKGIALIDDSGSYPRLKYVFDISDTEPTLENARPVKLWEMRHEHKETVLAEFAKNYENVSDTLADTFHNIANQLAIEYYNDNAHEIRYFTENSRLAPDYIYDNDNSPMDEVDDSELRAIFIENLSNSVAYILMTRCGIDTEPHFAEDAFSRIADFNTQDMVCALGTAVSDLSEQVLRDIEIIIRKYERVRAAQAHNNERSEQNYERNNGERPSPNLQSSRGLSSSEHQAERTSEGGNGANREIRANEENISQGTQDNNLQPPVIGRETVPAFEGNRGIGEQSYGTVNERINGEKPVTGQSVRPDGVGGGDERTSGTGGGNNNERADLQLESKEDGADEKSAPFSMSELKQHHRHFTEYFKNGILSDKAVLYAALNSDRQNTVMEIGRSLKRLHLELSQDIINSPAVNNKGDLINELDNYFNKERKLPLEHQLYDIFIYSDVFREQSRKNKLAALSQVETHTRVAAISEILSAGGSPITMDEVDSILRDGGNDKNSMLRIAAYFSKYKDNNTEFLKREYLHGRYYRDEIQGGKGFEFENHRVCMWFDNDGISLAIGITAKNNIHKIIIPWESAANRINELMQDGRYVTRDVFDEAIDNELDELAGDLWDFYRDDMRKIPDEWRSDGGAPGDKAIIKSLLKDFENRLKILDKLEIDVNSWLNGEDTRSWHDPKRLLSRMQDAMMLSIINPNNDFRSLQKLNHFITDDEIDFFITKGSGFNEGKFRIFSFFLNSHTDKERADFLKNEYGTGGGTWYGVSSGYHDHAPGSGITLKRYGTIFKPEAEVNMKYPVVVKRINKLISEGRYLTQTEFDYLPNYERLQLVQNINSFYNNLPDEYERPFEGKTGLFYNEYHDENGEKLFNFTYPKEAEWQAIGELLDNPERIETLFGKMQYIFENTSAEDRYYNSRKAVIDELTAFQSGTYTLFPGIKNLPTPDNPIKTQWTNDVIDLDNPFLNNDSISQNPQPGVQLSFNDFPTLPSVEEQKDKIEQKVKDEAAVEAVAFSDLQNDIDNQLLDISDADKNRIAVQFTKNSRSRDAVNLVKEIYGDRLSIPLPQAIKRISELVSDNKFHLETEISPKNEERPLFYMQFLQAKAIAPLESVIMLPTGDFFELYDEDAEIAEKHLGLLSARRKLSDTERITICGFPSHELDNNIEKLKNAGITVAVAQFDNNGEISVSVHEAKEIAKPDITDNGNSDTPLYKIGDTVYLENKTAYKITAISEFSGNVKLLDPTLSYPIIRVESKENFERMLSMYEGNEMFLLPPATEIKEVMSTSEQESEVAELDFDIVSQTVLEHVISDTDYKNNLAAAKNRADVRNPCGWAIEKSIRKHENDEQQLYHTYFFNENFRNKLFDFILKETWSNRETLIADAIEKTAPELDFDTVAQTVLAWVMQDTDYLDDLYNADSRGAIRSFLDHTLDKVITDKMQDEPEIYNRFFSDDDFNDHLFDFVYHQSWANRRQPEIPTAEKTKNAENPIAEKLLSLDGTDYYLIHFPESPDTPAALTFDTLSLITEQSEKYVICANVHNLSDDWLKRRNIEYRKMPRDFGLLPILVQDKITAINPRYAELYNDIKDISPPDENTSQIENSVFDSIRDELLNRGFVVSDEVIDYGISEYGEHGGKGDFQDIADYIENDFSLDEKPVPEVTPKQPKPKLSNFRITDDHLGEGGPKTKFRYNADAIKLLHDLEFDGRVPTPDEQACLSRYVGWGGLPQVFDPNNKQWENEYLELNMLLSTDEWESAKSSTLNAHYTSPVVIKAMYEVLERFGFKTGNILEPSLAIGNFFGLLPETMRNSKLYGVELDSLSARIAKYLYPNANIQETGFEKTQFSNAFFDVAIGNVPFGDYGVIDRRYEKYNFTIHNYFFAKALDQIRPNGIIAFITSKYTMDEKNPKVRKYIAERAELLGAVRLPNDAFLKNAGTETTTDIIFLQKRDRPLDIDMQHGLRAEWVHLGLTNDGIPVNSYYIDNPEMVLGTMALDERMNNKYGRNDATTCLPTPGADLAEQLKSALINIQGEYTITELDDLEGVDNHAIPADPLVKNFSYALVTPVTADGETYAGKIGEGQVYFRENSLMYPVDLPATTLERIKGMIGLRDCVNKLINLQLYEYSEVDIKLQQSKLNTLYDSFIAEFGLINTQANNRAFRADSAYYLLSSLEIIDEEGNLERKADMFTKRTIKQKTVITHVDTSSEALAVSLGEKACVDLEYMSELTGFSEEKLLKDLEGIVFLNVGIADSQKNTYVTADEYLSGNVRKKLELVRAAAATVPSLAINVKMLEMAQPKDLDASEISVRLGATWIEPKYVEQFMYELLNTTRSNQNIYKVIYHNYTGEWQITNKGRPQFSDFNVTTKYGTERMNAYRIIEDTLNLRDVRVYDYKTDADGKEKRELNKKETDIAAQRQELIKQAFKDWIWKEPERRHTLVKKYNDMFNGTRPREYDGSHLVLSGISPGITMRTHQLNAIARQIYGGNTLLAHVVGAGKTFEMIAAAMEMKRLGLCQKSLFAVPNHLTEQWAGEFLRLYPSANILVATKKEFEMRSRKKFCAKIATGDYDAIIVGHSQLEKIPMSAERQKRLIDEQISEIEQGIEDLRRNNGENFSIKQLIKTRKNLDVRLKKLLESKKRDDVVTFEQLGVDRLFVDEAHGFKNLFLYTKMRNVAGLSTSEAQKSSDLFMKCQYMDEITGNKGVIFATGTPISNSMTEMYTMQRYLQYDLLVKKNLIHFDSWASIFGETTTAIELAPEGTGYRARTRFAKFYNLPELLSMFKDIADIQTADMLNLPVPNAHYETVVVEPSDIQKEMVEALSKRAAAVHNREVEPWKDNMLKITTDGRKIGLDQRLINPLLPDFKGSKVNICTDNVFKIWSETAPYKLTQLIFCDFSTPHKSKNIPMRENEDNTFEANFESDYDAEFGEYQTAFNNVYEDIRTKLLMRGVPEHEIAFIHDANTEIKKKELFAKVRQGKVRILLGSTFKMGAGTNVQDRLLAIHDLDCPWRPADLEQRAGRIVRQGNNNSDVFVFRYATSGTFDSYLWQTVENKQKFIAQIMSSKSPVRSCEDVDETALSYAEIKALCAGNPLIAEKMNLDVEVAKLRMLKSEHQSQQYRLEDNVLKYYPEQITALTERISGIEKDIAIYKTEKEKCVSIQQNTEDGVTVESHFPGMVVNGVTYTEKEPAAKALLEACSIIHKGVDTPVGEYMGFKMSVQFEGFSNDIILFLRGNMTYKLELSMNAFGNITRINNSLEDLPNRLEGAKNQLEDVHRQKEAAQAEMGKPFPSEAQLNEKEIRLALLNSELNIDSKGENNADDIENTKDGYEPAIAKGRPSILDGLRTFNSEGKSPAIQGKDKAVQHDI